MAKAVIMAAGMGRRLEGAIGDIPKSLINLGGEALITKQINMLKECGIKKIAVVVGYRKEKIKELLGNNVTYYFNPFFETTNSVTSLWFAKELFSDEDVIVMNGDMLVESSIVKDLLIDKNPVCVTVEVGKYNEIGYKARIKDNFVDFMGMGIHKSEVAGEYVGISKVSKSIFPIFIKTLDNFMERKEFGTWYETAYVQMIGEGVRISFVDTNQRSWLEIDTPDDIEKAIQYFNSQ